MAIFAPLSIGRSALLAHERAIATTGQNIANAETPGYRRQATDLSSQDGSQGYGVRVLGVEQAVDRFLEAQLLRQNSLSSGADIRRDFLDRVQQLFPVDGPSVGGALDAFWGAAQRLADRPEDLAVRGDLLARAEELAARIRQTSAGLARQQREVDDRLGGQVEAINSQLSAIGSLNREIVAAEAGGARANELRDQRDQAMLALSEHLEIRATERKNGAVDIQIESSGVALVLDGDVQELTLEVGSTDGLDGEPLAQLGVRLLSGAVIDVPGNPGGEVGALLTLRDSDLVDLSADLDGFALGLRDAVNAVQTDAAATDLDGAVGTALFGGTGASDFEVILSDSRGIAAAVGSNAGDNTNALALLDVREASQTALNGATLSDYYSSLQSSAGSSARLAADQADVEAAARAALQGRRDAVSGVSLEEEFTDLIRFQRGFQAAAQLISVSDGLLEDLMGLVRR